LRWRPLQPPLQRLLVQIQRHRGRLLAPPRAYGSRRRNHHAHQGEARRHDSRLQPRAARITMHTAHTHNRTRRQGFTLLEVLIVMVLFTVVTGIVYATFSTVVNSAEDVRVDIERVRLEEYLIRSLTTNLATVFTDPMYEDANFHFVGKD